MFRQQRINKIPDFFKELSAREGKGVYFYRISGYNSEITDFIERYYESARGRGVVIEGRIPNPTEQNLSYYGEIMGMAFQMSESFLIAGILSISGGLQDAYTYMNRGKVFANAQTGNIVLLAQNLVDRNWQAVLRYFSPLLFFALGVAMAECIRMKYQKAQKIHWRQLVLAIEILLLFAVGFLPNEIDLLANAMVSFACAMQVQAFRKVNGYAFASTMCIGNLRSGMESLCAYGKTKDKKILRKSGYYFGIIFLFAVGAALGGHMIGYIGAKTIWISCTILLISFLCMFIKEEKEEHPEIMEEEQEIRDNLKNIRKEARDVEHILEDDIRSQIEKK